MKKILLLIALLISNICFSQEYYIGRITTEFINNLNISYKDSKGNIYVFIDSNTTDCYIIRQNTCVAFEKIIKKDIYEEFKNTYLNSWYKISDTLWSNNFFEASIIYYGDLYKILITKTRQ